MAITGSIISASIDQKQAGQTLVLKISWTAYNPNGSFVNWWSAYIIAKDDAGNSKMVKIAVVKADRITDSDDTLTLWAMPGKPVKVTVRLYGHDMVRDWDWAWWK